MSVIFLLIPLSIALATVFLFAFIWAVRSGQYEDTRTPSMRLLVEEARARPVKQSDATPIQPNVPAVATPSTTDAKGMTISAKPDDRLPSSMNPI